MQVRKIIKNLNSGKLTLDDFTNKDLQINLNEARMIGKGAVGKVYLSGDKVVKEIQPCNAAEDKPLYKYCTSVLKLDNNIPKIPGGFGKIRYSLPNLLSEISIGMILGKMVESPHFTKTTNSNIVDRKDFYIVMEAHQNTVINRQLNPKLLLTPNNPKTFIYMLFQISHALLTAQEKYRMTHYDLHIENVLWSPMSEDISYPLPNGERIVLPKSYCPFVLKISDFALARLETKDALVTPFIDNFPEKTYGEFHPSYDIVSFIGTVLIDNKYRQAFELLFSKNVDLYKFMILFSLWVLNDKSITITKSMGKSQLDSIRDIIGNKYFTKIGKVDNKFNFRPKKEGDFVVYSNTKSMVEIVDFLGKVLYRKNYAVKSNEISGLYLPRMKNYKEYNKVKKFIPEVPINNIPRPNESLGDYVEMKIDDLLKVRSYHTLTNLPPKTYNFTIEEKQLESCPIQEHYLTVLFVDKNYKIGRAHV